MINLAELGRVFIVCGKTDMHRGIDSLDYIVKKSFHLDPFFGCVFLFCGSRKDRFKALYWDGQGFWLLYKRFENGKLAWPNNEDEVRELSDEQVMRLMQGFTIDPKIKNTRARECIDFTSFSGIFMPMNQGGTTTMTDKDTSALIETLKATNEELLKQVALLTEQVRLTVKMTRTCPRITETITYKRRKQVGRKQDILASLSGEQVHYRLDDFTCPDCRHELKEIGVFCARQELLKLEVIHANETPYRVLDSETY